jgi:signal transduction histidine kinase
MSSSGPTSRREDWLEFWETRELPVIEAMPFVMVVVGAILDVAARGGLTGPMLVDLALCAAAAAAMASVAVLLRRDAGALTCAAAFLAIYAVMAAMVVRQPLYGFYTFTGYFFVFRLVGGRARLAGVAAVAVLSAISQTGSGPYESSSKILGLAVIYLINLAVAGTLTWFGYVGQEQKDRRVALIEELTEANIKLERSLSENAELQEQLLAQAHEAGIADERRRMAREIHDTLAQGLAGIVTQLQAAQQAGRERGARHVQTAIELARDSLSEARRSVQALAPEPLQDARLPDAVREVAARWSSMSGVPSTVTTTGEARMMRPEIEVALLRTAQEALANVAKHAHASRVGLTLSYMEDVVTLDVRDDGVGLPVGGVPPLNGGAHHVNGDGASGGFGLAAMRQRVEGVSGTLAIESEPRAGVAVSASVPAIPRSGQ